MERFPGKEVLSFKEVSQFTGMGYYALKDSGIPFNRTKGRHGFYWITIASLARWLC